MSKDLESDIGSYDGSNAQVQLGNRPARKHFFSPLDRIVAEAVKADADRVTYTEEEEVRKIMAMSISLLIPLLKLAVKKKVDWRILPLVIGRSFSLFSSSSKY